MRALSRRVTMLGASAAVAGLLSEPASAQPANSPVFSNRFFPGTVAAALRPKVVRRLSAAALPPGHKVLESYRRAITKMIALPTTDPRNWSRQADLHFNVCAHQNWFTLPWHRAYLSAFENICADLSGDEDFRVPYWDWTANPQFPASFMQPVWNGAPNPLFHPRARSATDTLSTAITGQGVMDAIFGEPNFEFFGSSRPSGQNNTDPKWQQTLGTMGPLESNPHNNVHTWTGNDMATFHSPLDPLFWLHHSNIDRIWDRWNGLGGANPTEAMWRNFTFSGQFVSTVGGPWNPTVSSLLNVELLGYRYGISIFDRLVTVLTPLRILPSVNVAKMQRQAVTVPENAVATTGQPLALRLPVDSAARLADRVLQPQRALRSEAAVDKMATATVAGRVTAFVEAIAPDVASPMVRMFLNCDYLTPETSELDPHYVGAFSFFMRGMPHDGGNAMPGMATAPGSGQTARLAVDLTQTLLALREAGRLPDGPLTLQLQPLPGGPNQEAPAVRVRSLEFTVS
jgi:tyrosinase